MRPSLSSIFGFTSSPVTTLVVVTYLAIFAATVVIHEYGWPAPPAGEQQMGLDLEAAARDLQVIARLPHPYNSERNDAVRNFILSRVRLVADAYPDTIEVEDDLISNITIVNGESLVYFEGNNILLKMEGTRPGLPAVLLSAHFDSVSTAPGATDDGMGVATLLQLIRYYADHPPERTLIFNINNAEEDGLFGARAFLAHPWSSLPQTFLNLEGAGSGGRPLLFRTSGTRVTRAFERVDHPHANALSSDAFRYKLVRSGTDFTVYEEKGMKGLDLAFYRGRSRYHTKGDSVASLRGRDSLWAMMEAALGATEGLMADYGADAGSDDVVYFDVLGDVLAVFNLSTFFLVNLALLIGGPIIVFLLLWFSHLRSKAAFPLAGWFRFPVAFILSTGLTIGLGFLYRSINPYIVYSASYTVAISMIATYYLVSFLTLSIFDYFRPVHQQKLVVLLETFVFWWLMLAVATGFLNVKHMAATYFVTFFAAGALFALLVALLESLILESIQSRKKTAPAEDADEFDEGEYEPAGAEAEATERTPLVQRAGRATGAVKGEQQIPAFWLFQFWLVLVFPVIWATQTALLLMTALGQTLVDGSSPMPVYLGIALMCSFIVLPLAPFIHKMNSSVAIVLVISLACTAAWNLLGQPFTAAIPFKVFFQQTVNLDDGSNLVNLVGIPGYVRPLISPDIPSAYGGNITCHDKSVRPGLESCTWNGLPPNVLGEAQSSLRQPDDWITARVNRTGPQSARILLGGTKTRVCRIFFDKPVTSVSVAGGTGPSQPVPYDGVTTVSLWSRTWGKEFDVEVSWREDDDDEAGGEALSGRVACEWADMATGRIPALDEVVEFLPLWAIVTKLTDGLVVVSRSFNVNVTG